MNQFRESLRTFFRSKRQQLLEAASEADTPHTGLLGSHREALVRDFFAALLPRRFSVGRGIVFGYAHQSREADLVIWDSQNYPSISFPQHSHFFAESVRVVLEAKSRYSATELEDMLSKCKAVRDIVPLHTSNLSDEVAMLQLEVTALKRGHPHGGMLIGAHHTASAGFFFRGGQDFRLSHLTARSIDAMDDSWPDVLIFLDAGIVIGKEYAPAPDGSPDGFGGTGYATQVAAADDSLLVFAVALMSLINARSVQIEDPSFLGRYVPLGELCEEIDGVSFRLTRPVAGRTPLWSRSEDV